MPVQVATYCVFIGASASLVYYALAIWSARRFLGKLEAPPTDFAPPVSILKPVRGLDRDALANFASFCLQEYPVYEILFSVADAEDPAIPVLRQIIEEYPSVSIRLLIGSPQLGPNSKVNKLCRLAKEAQYDVLVISDSDIRVGPEYLDRIVAPLRDPTVAAVTCLYRGISTGSVIADLEALGISAEFAAGVLVARQLEGVRFALGASISTSRARLADIGGFEALVDFCADDFELGDRLASRGYTIELSRYVVSSTISVGTWGAYWRHQLRWAISTRHCRPWGHLGLLLTQGLPWVTAAAILAQSRTVAVALPIVYLVLRHTQAWMIGWIVLRDPLVRRRWWLLPTRDALAFCVWVASLVCNRIEWRGRRFRVKHGRLIPDLHT